MFMPFITTPHMLPPARPTASIATLSSSAVVYPERATSTMPSTKVDIICASATVFMGDVSIIT